MIISPLTSDDINKLRLIWEKHFKNEFKFPDFLNGFNATFTVYDDNGSIITAGGIRPIAEMVIITDKDKNARKRAFGMKSLLKASEISAFQVGYSQLHAFVQGDEWTNIVKKMGFAPCKGNALFLELQENYG